MASTAEGGGLRGGVVVRPEVVPFRTRVVVRWGGTPGERIVAGAKSWAGGLRLVKQVFIESKSSGVG